MQDTQRYFSSPHIEGGRILNPETFFEGNILVVVPHMDDCVLACGGTIMQTPHKERIQFVYSTDGRGTVKKSCRQQEAHPERDIGAIRMEETRKSLNILGISTEHIHFLDFPELKLRYHKQALCTSLRQLLQKFQPSHVLAPFRYDKHPDHVTVNAVVRELASLPGNSFRLLEYFVYYQWKFLPAGDIRYYLNPDYLLKTDIQSVSLQKRQALNCFMSQITCFYEWQYKPVLSDALLDAFSAGPEIFLESRPDLTDRDILRISPFIVHLLHTVDPFLKNSKEHLLSLKHNLLRKIRTTGTEKCHRQ